MKISELVVKVRHLGVIVDDTEDTDGLLIEFLEPVED